MMPGMSGTTLTAEALKQRPDIKVLYATGGDGYVSNELAATELLRKPIARTNSRTASAPCSRAAEGAPAAGGRRATAQLYFCSSSRPIWLRCTSSGPSASRKVRAPA